MDSICVTWIDSENRYRITILIPGKDLITHYAADMQMVIDILEEEENAA